jgi:multisite-specific tRNA:(cytosine-C5)-methyltransferase
MVFPLWKSLHSLNLMLPKEERRALLLRLFNDETPLVNETQKKKANQQNGDAKAEKATVLEGPAVRLKGEWNSSSPEPDIGPGPADPDEEEGGVSLSGADAIDAG